MSPKIRKDTRGFTLVEVLVGLALFSTILLTLFSAFQTFSTSVDQVTRQRQFTEAGHPGLQAMLADLGQLFLVPYPRYKQPQNQNEPDPYKSDPFRLEGTEVSIDGQTFSQLSFACVNPAPITAVSEKGIARITYYIHRHGDRLDLHRADRDWPFDSPLAPCTDPVLAREIARFSLTYYDQDNEEASAWNSDAPSVHYAFPRRIGIILEFKHEDKNSVLRTALALPVTREAAQ